MVADDNRDTADSLGILLEMMGHEVQRAYDGASAISLARTYRPDIALLDIGLPDMSGLDVARSIRGLPNGRDVLLIAVTGWGQDDDRRRSAEAGFDHHLIKPLDRAALESLLGTGSRQRASP
jgi:DNA-binding response OmpR family regulator